MALLEELKPGVMVKGLFSCVFIEYKNTHCKFDTEKQILLQCLWHAWSHGWEVSYALKPFCNRCI